MASKGPLVIGLLAPADAGKTTLSEALLVEAGQLKKKGRVDHGDSLLDGASLERQRGITIFAKTARLTVQDQEVQLLDTPGHTDFAAETERTLKVLDGAVLLINGADGVTPRLRQLERQLADANVPTIFFVNKTDQAGFQKAAICQAIKDQWGDSAVDFAPQGLLSREEVALASEALMEEYLDQGYLTDESLRQAVLNRRVLPVYFGSALEGTGVADLLAGCLRWLRPRSFQEELTARVIKISRDDDNQRLTWLRLLGGQLKVRQRLGKDKVTEIRLCDGARYETVSQLKVGQVAVLVGLKDTYAGQFIGRGEEDSNSKLSPVMAYSLKPKRGEDLPALRSLLADLAEEWPELALSWQEETMSFSLQLLGDLSRDLLLDSIAQRQGPAVELGPGEILYREGLKAAVAGLGHYEPLRHYAEVHVLLEPHDGQAVKIESKLMPGQVPLAWEGAVLNSLRDHLHRGSLLGLPLAGVKISLLAVGGHEKHTVGGDFRQAALRAVRQGLMTALAKDRMILLEPYYDFEAAAPLRDHGRILADLNLRMAQVVDTKQTSKEIQLKGRGPVARLKDYPKELLAFTKGAGRMRLSPGGYEACHNQAEVLQDRFYDALADEAEPSSSVFCHGGVAQIVAWDEVPEKVHLEPRWLEPQEGQAVVSRAGGQSEGTIDLDTIDAIMKQTFYANANPAKKWQKSQQDGQPKRTNKAPAPRPKKEGIITLVDAYNVIHAWPDLKELVKTSLDGAREKLLASFQDYQGYTGEEVVLVFDAYRVAGARGLTEKRDNVTIYYTSEGETADQYIERMSRVWSETKQVKVVTSDRAVQMSAVGSGALAFSVRRFSEIMAETKQAGQSRAGTEATWQGNRPFEDNLKSWQGPDD